MPVFAVSCFDECEPVQVRDPFAAGRTIEEEMVFPPAINTWTNLPVGGKHGDGSGVDVDALLQAKTHHVFHNNLADPQVSLALDNLRSSARGSSESEVCKTIWSTFQSTHQTQPTALTLQQRNRRYRIPAERCMQNTSPSLPSTPFTTEPDAQRGKRGGVGVAVERCSDECIG